MPDGTIINYYKILPAHLKNDVEYYNPNAPLIPPHPMRFLIVGASGKGKTDLLLNIIFQSDNFDHIYIVAKSPDQPLYNWLKHKLGKKLTIYAGGDELPPVEEISDKNSKQILVVFDDCVVDKKLQPKIDDYFVRARPKNCSVGYLSQTYYKVGTAVRLNCSQLYLLKATNKRNLKGILRDHSMDVNEDKAYRMYLDSVNDKDSEIPFLLIDTQTPNPNLQFRKGFKKAYILDHEKTEDPFGQQWYHNKNKRKRQKGPDDIFQALKDKDESGDAPGAAEDEEAALEAVNAHPSIRKAFKRARGTHGPHRSWPHTKSHSRRGLSIASMLGLDHQL
jgi:hypothetical protein